MALSAVDSATIAAFTSGQGVGAGSVTSAAFTAGASTLIVVTVQGDGDTGVNQVATVTSSPSLTWVKAIEHNNADGLAAHASIHVAQCPSAVSRTITLTMAGNLKPIACKAFILSGHDLTSPIGATAKGESTTLGSTSTGTYTSTRNGSQGFGSAMDWSNGTSGTSTDSKDIHAVGGTADGLSLWKAALTTTSGTAVSFNLNMSSGPQWAWVSCEILPAVAAAATTPVDRRQLIWSSLGLN